MKRIGQHIHDCRNPESPRDALRTTVQCLQKLPVPRPKSLKAKLTLGSSLIAFLILVVTYVTLSETAERIASSQAEKRAAEVSSYFATAVAESVAVNDRMQVHLLAEAFRNEPSVEVNRRDNQYLLDLGLADERRQRVYVETSDHAAAERLLRIYSLCCDARPDYYENALRLNSELLHGGLAIRDVEGHPMFVVSDTFPRSTVQPEAIRRSVLEVAARADYVEQLLTGADIY